MNHTHTMFTLPFLMECGTQITTMTSDIEYDYYYNISIIIIIIIIIIMTARFRTFCS